MPIVANGPLLCVYLLTRVRMVLLSCVRSIVVRATPPGSRAQTCGSKNNVTYRYRRRVCPGSEGGGSIPAFAYADRLVNDIRSTRSRVLYDGFSYDDCYVNRSTLYGNRFGPQTDRTREKKKKIRKNHCMQNARVESHDIQTRYYARDGRSRLRS